MNKNSNVSFSGISLSQKQRNDVRLNMKSELGEENYGLIESFFNFIVNSKAKYKAIIARKCFNLFNLYYRCNFGSPVAEIEDKVISDNALFAYIPEIASEYLEWGFFPEILIADDILIHGRAINSLLDSFIQSVYSFIRDKGVDKEYPDIESDILKSTNIITIVQSDNTLLMKPAYYQRLFTSGYEFHVWEPVEWHDLSLRIAQLNCEGPFSNTSHTFSLYEQQANANVNKYVADVALGQGFMKSEWNKRNVRDVWVKPLRSEDGDIFAFYTIRITLNLTLNRYSIIPFVVLPDISASCCMALLEKIFSQSIIENLNCTFPPQRPSAELMNLALNYNLLLLLNQEDNRIPVSNDVLDIDKMMLNFGKDSVFGKAFSELLVYKKPFLSWDELNDFIISGSKQFSPVMKLYPKPLEIKYRSLNDAFEETIAEEGEKSELDAYQEYAGQKYVSEIQLRQPIRNLFEKIEQSSGLQYNDREIIELVADILRHMDLGAVSVGSERRNDNCDCFSCVYRAGEQSQFLHPKKYADHLPVLLEMEKDCNSNCKEIVQRIERFYGEESELKKKLISFVNYLYHSGQRLRDWDIDWLNCTEVDDKTRQMGENKSREELIASQMIVRIMRRHDELSKYRAMYPQQY